jgi:hypothetical protein
MGAVFTIPALTVETHLSTQSCGWTRKNLMQPGPEPGLTGGREVHHTQPSAKLSGGKGAVGNVRLEHRSQEVA